MCVVGKFHIKQKQNTMMVERVPRLTEKCLDYKLQEIEESVNLTLAHLSNGKPFVSEIYQVGLSEFETNFDQRLSKLEAQNEEILKVVTKRKEVHEDENHERGNWTGRFDFFLSCLGYAVGLGNVWRFPYLCYRNGGGAFFIPYAIMLGLVGIPIFILELAIGQFSSQGPFTCWRYAPIFTGVGYGMFIVSALVSIYYNMIIAWAFYYLFASFTDKLPWDGCGEWSTNMCYYNIKVLNSSIETCDNNRWTSTSNQWFANETQGVCYYNATSTTKADIVAFINVTLARLNGFKRTLPSEEYFERHVTGAGLSAGLGDLGNPRWQLVLCYLLAFICVTLALSKSIKTSGRVVYFTATFPYVVLIILFIRGLFLEGYDEGIKFYITPQLDRLMDSRVWKDAAVQIFFSLSASWGGLIALSSYNRFHNDCLRDAISVAFGNCLTSVFAGFVIFSYLGHLSNWLGTPISEVAKSGPSLTFAVYPFAVTLIPPAPLWSILFFLMLITLGVDSEFVLTETVTTSLMDRIHILRKYKLMTVMSICALFFLLGLTLTTNGGIYMLEVMDTYSGGWNILVIAICECLSVSYAYGVFRFLDDIELMIGQRICGCFPYFISKYWWLLCWCLITPGLCAFIMIFSWVDYKDMEGEKFPPWSDVLGWMMTLCVIVAIFGTAIILFIITPGDCGERMKALFSPTVEWGPMLVKHRQQALKHTLKYDRNFVVDPWGKSDEVAPVAPEYEQMKSNIQGIPNTGYVPYVEETNKL